MFNWFLESLRKNAIERQKRRKKIDLKSINHFYMIILFFIYLNLLYKD